MQYFTLKRPIFKKLQCIRAQQGAKTLPFRAFMSNILEKCATFLLHMNGVMRLNQLVMTISFVQGAFEIPDSTIDTQIGRPQFFY